MSKEICTKYIDALNESDLEKVLSLSTEKAMVVSPLYGKVAVIRVYKDLFSDTQRSDIRLLNILNFSNKGNSIGLHFHYTWTLQNGEVVKFEVGDVFNYLMTKVGLRSLQ